MARLVLGPLLRHVTDTTATIWVETDAAVHGRGARAPDADVHRLRPPLRARDRRGPRARLDDPLRGAPRRRALLAAARRAVPAERDPHPRWRPAADPVRFVPRRRAARAAVVARVRSRRARPRRRRAATPTGCGCSASRPTSGRTCCCSSATRCTPTTPRRRPGPRSSSGAATSSTTTAFPVSTTSPTSRSTPGCTTRRGCPEVERWVLSVVPSAMIFDDHDMIDDWNTSIVVGRGHPAAAVVAGPRHRRADVVLGVPAPREPLTGRDPRRGHAATRFIELGDATDGADGVGGGGGARSRGVPGGYRFSFYRELGPVRLVVIDSRNGRVLEPGAAADGRRRASGRGWSSTPTSSASTSCWRRRCPWRCPAGCTTSSSGTSWCATGRGASRSRRLGEKIRRAVDLEDWSAFHDTYVER